MHTNKWLSLSIAVLLSACASTDKATYRFNTLEPADHIQLVDLRAADDKLFEKACRNGGLSNIGDKYVEPSKLALLQSHLGKVLPTATTIEVTQFNLRLIMSDHCGIKEEATGIGGAVGGAVGYAVGAAIAAASDDPTPTVPEGVLCELRFTMNGREYKGESYVGSQKGINALNARGAHTEKLIAPINKAVDVCIDNALHPKPKAKP